MPSFFYEYTIKVIIGKRITVFQSKEIDFIEVDLVSGYKYLLSEACYNKFSSANETAPFLKDTIEEFEQKWLYGYAITALSRSPHSIHMLDEKLQKRSKNKHIVSAVITSLIDIGYLNDDFLIPAFIIKEMKKGYGTNILSQKLRKVFGVGEFASYYPSTDIQNEILKKYCMRKKWKSKQAFIQHGLRKGHRFQLLCKIWDELF